MIINVLKQANDTIRDSVQISENKHAADVFKKQVMSLQNLPFANIYCFINPDLYYSFCLIHPGKAEFYCLTGVR